EQMAPHRSLVIGGGALALARDLGRDEAQRVELGMGVLERGPRVRALVDDQVDVGGIRGVGAHALAPRGHRARESLIAELGERRGVLRRVDDHLVGARCGLEGEQARLARARRGAERIRGAREAGLRGGAGARRAAVRAAVGAQHRVEVRHRPRRPARRIRRAPSGAACPDLRRGSVLASLAEGAVLRGIVTGDAGRGHERVGARRPAGRQDRAQARELVDADLGSVHLGEPGTYDAEGGSDARGSAWRPSPASKPRNGFTMSSGSGKTIVEFWFTPMSSRVCRYLSWSVAGLELMMLAACDSFSAAWNSPSAEMIFARRSRSASAWRA